VRREDYQVRILWIIALGVSTLTLLDRSAVRAEEVPSAVLQAEQARIAAIAKAVEPSISIFVPGGQGGGSGVVISPDGYALSNFHVTKPAGDYMQCSMSDGNLYDAVIVGLDPTGDVALVKLLGRDDFPHAELGDSDQVRVGDWCFAVGNPFLLATDFQPTVSWGLVSGVHRYQYPAGTLLEYADCLQTDASINPGNSGGPLFNSEGQLIGINGRCSFEKRGRVNVGVGYAISINQIKNFIGYLRSGRIVDHATLGATVSSHEDGRVVVSNILESSDAFRRGLRYGDEIVAFGGRPVTTVNGFKNVLGIFPKGWRVPLSFRHDGERRDVYVRLSGVHSREELLEKTGGAPKVKPVPVPVPVPERKPADEPKGEQAPPKDVPPPGPKPAPKKQRKIAIPAGVKELIVKRPGYANYYFNERNRERVWDAFRARGDFSDTGTTWHLTGVDDGGGAVVIELGEAKVTGQFPRGTVEFDTEGDLAEQSGPVGSGGLLMALHIWQRMLRQGPERFGEVFYQGTAPVLEREGLYDVLIATYDVVESHFFFDPGTGSLIALETFADEDVDPCEVYFGDYRELEGRQVPHALVVRHGDRIFASIKLESLQLSRPAPDGENES
jgi:S1-C subfamily serine protease